MARVGPPIAWMAACFAAWPGTFQRFLAGLPVGIRRDAIVQHRGLVVLRQGPFVAVVWPEGILIGGRFALARFPNRQEKRGAGELPSINEHISRALDGGRAYGEDGLSTNRVGGLHHLAQDTGHLAEHRPERVHGKRLCRRQLRRSGSGCWAP